MNPKHPLILNIYLYTNRLPQDYGTKITTPDSDLENETGIRLASAPAPIFLKSDLTNEFDQISATPKWPELVSFRKKKR